MSIIGQLLGGERSGVTGVSSPANPSYWIQKLFGGGKITLSGAQIDEENAIGLSAVWNAISIISGAVGFLPFNVYKRLPGGGRERAVNHPMQKLIRFRPNPYMDALTFRELLQSHALGWGNGYAEIERRNDGMASALWPLRPDRVTPEVFGPEGDRRVRYRYQKENGAPKCIPYEDMYHIKGLSPDGLKGYSTISVGAESLGAAKAAQDFASIFFKNNATPAAVITHPGEMGDKAEKHVRESWAEQHDGTENAHKVAFLEEGMDIKTIGISPNDAQLLTTRQFDVVEVARWFDIPPHMLKSMEQATFSNIEHQGIQFVVWTLSKWLTRWEQETHYKLFGEEGRRKFFVEFVTAALLRGDTKARFDAYRVAINSGWMNRNQARTLENMNPEEGLSTFWQPVNVVEVGSEAPEVDPAIVAATISAVRALVVKEVRVKPDETGAEPKQTATEPEESRSEPDANEDIPPKIGGAFADLWRDTWRRITTKEINSLTRIITKPDPTDRIDAFYAKHETHVREVIAPVLKAIGVGPDKIDDEARKYVEDSRGDLIAATDRAELLEEWRENKALRMAEEFIGRGKL